MLCFGRRGVNEHVHPGWRPAEGGPEFGSGCVVVVEANVAARDELGQPLQTLVDDSFSDSAPPEVFSDGKVREVASSSVVATQDGADNLRIQNSNLTEARVSLEVTLDLLATVGRFMKADAVGRFPQIADLVVVFDLHWPEFYRGVQRCSPCIGWNSYEASMRAMNLSGGRT